MVSPGREAGSARWAGPPAAVDPARPGAGPPGRGGRPAVERLLMIQTYYMGDVILATPAIRAARRAFPGARIDFLTGPAGAAALDGNPHLDEVIRLEPGLGGQLAVMRTLRRRRYDTVVDLLSNPRTAVIVAAMGAALRVGIRAGGPRDLAYTHLIGRETGQVYIARQKLRLLAPLGIEPDAVTDLGLEVAIGPAERRWAAATWDRLGLGGDAPVVAVTTVSRERFKQWGAARWAAVADRLAGAGLRVLLTHGPGERDQVAAVAERMEQPAVWDHGPTTIRQLAALYERCALWVGNDGGPKHVAVAAGVPTITAIRWKLGPVWTDTTAAVPHLAIDRPPPQGCDRRCARCAHLGCLGAIAPETIVAAALEALNRPGAVRG